MIRLTEFARTLSPAVHETAREAGAIAKGWFRTGERTSARVWSKSGGSPVTEADVSVDAFLKVRLSHILPEAGWLSEETADDPGRLDRRLVWIVDPIDGTRAFLNGHPDWSVAIALLADGRPLAGVVYGPAHDAFYAGLAGLGSTLNGAELRVSSRQDLAGAGVTGPAPLVDRLESRAGRMRALEKIPSLALRLARVAEGVVDVGLVSSDARDWDLAAADLILREAGGRLTGLDGAEPAYNRPDPVHGELVATSERLHPDVIEAMTARSRPAAQRG